MYSPQNYNCIKCIDGYILTNNVCVTCKDSFYIDTYGQCRPNPINCKVANQFGQCTNCIAGYTLINGICTVEILYCQTYNNINSQIVCQQCYPGYYLRDPFTCVRLPNGCAVANSTGFCLQCY